MTCAVCVAITKSIARRLLRNIRPVGSNENAPGLTHWWKADAQAVALFTGVLLGLVAQVLRQISGPLMDIGAATAPWVTMGFVIAVWATRAAWPLRSAGRTGAGVMAAYLFAWLFAYHSLYAVRESVGFAAAWREAAPWLVVAGPAALVLGFVAARSHRRGLQGDACLASPIAWSLPEVIHSSQQGWSAGGTVAVVIAAVAFVPLVVAARRDVRLVRVALASALLGGVALALSPILLGQIHS
jgi:hypothetical protein